MKQYIILLLIMAIFTIKGYAQDPDDNCANDLKIYPNPTSGRLQIEYLQELPSTIRILDMSGKVAFETIAQQRNQTIDLTELPQGVYVVEIIGKEQTEKQLIVIQ